MRMYGNLGSKILKDAKRYDDLGEFFGGNLYESEVRYLIEHEWARSVEDILWRRTKEGLRRAKIQGKQLGRPKGSKDKKPRRKSGYLLKEAKKRMVSDQQEGKYFDINYYLNNRPPNN